MYILDLYIIYVYIMRRDPITTFFGDTPWQCPFSKFQTPNSRSKPINMMDILRVTCKSNFTFFWIFLLFIKYLTKSLYSDRWIFVPIWINPKKIQKNVKFDLQAHFNISNNLNGLDRPFGVCKKSVSRGVTKKRCNRIPPHIYIYIYIGESKLVELV